MRTMLYDQHVALGAKMVNFAGWEMPLYYRGVVHEHNTVRESAGIFDVSHMGRILIEGKEAEPFLDHLCTNNIADKKGGCATYTVWCNENGFCIDDVLIYKENPESFFVIVNAGNREKDLNHLKRHAKKFDVFIHDCFLEEGILAVQGPNAYLPELEDLPKMHFKEIDGVILSHTGYTGAGGFELYGDKEMLVSLWKEFLDQGIEPAGLGARDTLRLEMGYALYGHELSETISPLETVAAWTVKTEKENFLGKEALTANRSQHGVILLDKGIARQGNTVLKDDAKIGEVTSGTFSPTLQSAIAIVFVDSPLKEGETVQIEVRGKPLNAQVAPLPFVPSH